MFHQNSCSANRPPRLVAISSLESAVTSSLLLVTEQEITEETFETRGKTQILCSYFNTRLSSSYLPACHGKWGSWVLAIQSLMRTELSWIDHHIHTNEFQAIYVSIIHEFLHHQGQYKIYQWNFYVLWCFSCLADCPPLLLTTTCHCQQWQSKLELLHGTNHPRTSIPRWRWVCNCGLWNKPCAPLTRFLCVFHLAKLWNKSPQDLPSSLLACTLCIQPSWSSHQHFP